MLVVGDHRILDQLLSQLLRERVPGLLLHKSVAVLIMKVIDHGEKDTILVEPHTNRFPRATLNERF